MLGWLHLLLIDTCLSITHCNHILSGQSKPRRSLSKGCAFSGGQQSPKMSRDVTYAELQIVRTPLENNPQPLQEGPAGGDLTYENVQAAKPQEATPPNSSKWHKGPNQPFWPITWGLLGATLFLLATTVGFGVRYRQVSWHLQEALAVSAAESSTRARSLIDAHERDLAQMRRRLWEVEAELHRSQVALRESGRLVNSTREQLQRQQEKLTTEAQERRAAEEALNATLAKACADWCPEDWLLYGGKCLFFSAQGKSWTESSKDCEKRSARLLAVTSEVPAEILKPLESNVYWTGTWTEGNSVHTPHRENRHPKCPTLKKGKRTQDFCQQQRRYICEQPATPPAPVRLLRRLAGDLEAASPA